MIKRDKYPQQLIKARNNGFPKVITGIRRCGKSYLLEEIFRSYLLSDGVNADKCKSPSLRHQSLGKPRCFYERTIGDQHIGAHELIARRS